MKKGVLVFLTCCLFSLNAIAKETWVCPQLKGYTSLLENASKWEKIKAKFRFGLIETYTILGKNQIIIDGDNSRLVTETDSKPTPLLLFNNNDSKADLLEIGSVASSIYTIDKKQKKLFYVGNGVVPEELKGFFHIENGYQKAMTANCDVFMED